MNDPAGNHIPETNYSPPQQQSVATGHDHSTVQHDSLMDVLKPWEPGVIHEGFGITDNYLDNDDFLDALAFLLEEPDGNPTAQPDNDNDNDNVEAGREEGIEGDQPSGERSFPQKKTLTEL